VPCGGGREAFSCYAEPHLPPGQGSITTRELGQLLRALGKNPTQDELTKLFQKVDPQQEGAVKFETFVNCMLEPMKQPGALVRLASVHRALPVQQYRQRRFRLLLLPACLSPSVLVRRLPLTRLCSFQSRRMRSWNLSVLSTTRVAGRFPSPNSRP
jgi:hypothetical protein